MIGPCGYQVANERPQPRDDVCYLCHTSQLGAFRPGNGGDGTENQVNQVKILKSGAETVVMWSPRWGETWDTDQWWGDPGALSRWWWPHWPWPGVTRLQRTPREMSHHSQAGGQWLQLGGHCVCDSAYSVIVSIVSVSFIPGHWPLSESLPSPSARTVEWTEGPLCPLWGPMDSFYEEGIEKGRVSELR